MASLRLICEAAGGLRLLGPPDKCGPGRANWGSKGRRAMAFQGTNEQRKEVFEKLSDYTLSIGTTMDTCTSPTVFQNVSKKSRAYARDRDQ